MPKKLSTVLLIATLILVTLLSTTQTLAFFVVPLSHPRSRGQFSVQAQDELPTQAIPPTLPVELWSQTATPGPDGFIKHTILQDQFLWNIAELYGVSLQEIYQLNNMTEDSITFPGQVIIIKKVEEPTPEPTATPIEIEETSTPTFDASILNLQDSEPTLMPTPEASQDLLARIFTNNSRYLAFGIIGLVLLGVVLLIVSSRRIH